MTKVVFFEDGDGRLCGFEAAGHARYAESGRDIVCAAISALTQATVLGLEEVACAPVQTRTDEDTGYLRCMLSGSPKKEALDQAQVLFRTLEKALTAISNDYPGTIRIIIRERR